MDVNCQIECVGKNQYVFGMVFWGEGDCGTALAIQKGGLFQTTDFNEHARLPETNIAGWWFQICFHFHPYLGKIPILTNIFQRG